VRIGFGELILLAMVGAMTMSRYAQIWTNLMAGPLLVILAAGAATAQALPHSEWITLGTQSGPTPRANKSQPANLLHYADQYILVDAGDGAAEQLAKAGVRLAAVRTVFISHLHFDHTSGLFAILGLRYQLSNPPITIYGPLGTKKLVEGLVAAMQPFVDLGSGQMRGGRMPPADYVKAVEIPEGSTVQVGAAKVTAVRNTHYSFPKDSPNYKYPSFSYRFDMPDRAIVYTGDTGPSAAVELLAAHADLLVSEVVDSDYILGQIKAEQLETPPVPGASPEPTPDTIHHMTAEHLSPENVGLLAQHAGVAHLVLTHQELKPGADRETVARVARNFKGAISLGKDLDRF
jgi:ribonuclease BN (tRNA processing enzyme)